MRPASLNSNSSRATIACHCTGNATVRTAQRHHRKRSAAAGDTRQQHTHVAAAASHGEHSGSRQRPEQPQQQQQQEFQQVLAEVQQLPYRELAQRGEQAPEHRAFSASFLFWLSAQEKKAAAGPAKQVRWHGLDLSQCHVVLLTMQFVAQHDRGLQQAGHPPDTHVYQRSCKQPN